MREEETEGKGICRAGSWVTLLPSFPAIPGPGLTSEALQSNPAHCGVDAPACGLFPQGSRGHLQGLSSHLSLLHSTQEYEHILGTGCLQ